MKKIISILFIALVITGFTDTSQLKPLQVDEFKLKNGLEVKMIQFGSIPALTIGCYVNVGKKSEIPGQQHLSSLVADGLLLGNENHSRIEQDNIVAKLGTKITANVNDNYTLVNIRFLNKDAATAMELFSSVILKPTFPSAEIKQNIEETLNYNNPYKMDINDLAGMFSDYVVYGSSNPLGRHFYSSQLNKTTTEQIKEFYKFNYTPKNTKLVLVGNFDKQKMKELVTKAFEAWTAAYGESNSAAYEVEDIKKKHYFFAGKNNATQAYLQWSKKAPEAGSKEAILFRMANISFNKLLFDEIRAKEGKTYGIYCSFDESENNGIYSISTQVRNEVAYPTVESFDRVLKQFYSTEITQAQLLKAKGLLKNVRLAAETPESIMNFYNPILYKDINKRNEYFSIIDAATADQVNKTIKKYFNPDSYKLVIVGDETILNPQLQKVSGLVKLSVKDIEKDN
jgi:zinc protease